MEQKFTSYYTKVIQNTSGRIPSKLGAISSLLRDSEIVKRIVDSYKKHTSMKIIEEEISRESSFHFEMLEMLIKSFEI